MQPYKMNLNIACNVNTEKQSRNLSLLIFHVAVIYL